MTRLDTHAKVPLKNNLPILSNIGVRIRPVIGNFELYKKRSENYSPAFVSLHFRSMPLIFSRSLSLFESPFHVMRIDLSIGSPNLHLSEEAIPRFHLLSI